MKGLIERYLDRVLAIADLRDPQREALTRAEMRDHLERATERLVQRGMSPEDARLQARREFGNVATLQEDARDARGARWIEALAGDVRFALRHFARRRLASLRGG